MSRAIPMVRLRKVSDKSGRLAKARWKEAFSSSFKSCLIMVLKSRWSSAVVFLVEPRIVGSPEQISTKTGVRDGSGYLAS